MAEDYFDWNLAINEQSGSVVPNAIAKVYAITDTAYATPLAITDVTGVPMVDLKASPTGLYPPFKVPTGQTQVLVKSAEVVTPLTSLLGHLLSVLPDPATGSNGDVVTVQGGELVYAEPQGGGGGGPSSPGYLVRDASMQGTPPPEGTPADTLIVYVNREGGETPIFATSKFIGGAIGTPVTAVTEPVFTARDGLSLVYAAGPFGTGGAMKIESSSGALSMDVTGRTQARFRFYISRDAGVQTAGMLAMLFSDAGGVNIADAFFRNQGGGQWALRRNFLYQGQAATAHAEGETWRVEAWYVNGQEIGLALWAPADIDDLAPTYQWVTAITADVATVRFGNATGATGLFQRWSYFVASSAVAIPIGPEVA